jgi:hypothetical protein
MNSTKNLEIPKKITSEKLENILVKLNNSPENINLQIPMDVDYRGFGHLPTLFLVLFTWMRTKKGNIILPIKKNDLNASEAFTLNYYGYTTLSTFWRHCEILDSEGLDIKSQFKDYTTLMHQYIESLSSKLPLDSIMIPCFDHYSNEKGLPHWIYSYDFKFCETPSDLENSLYHIFTKLRANYKERINRNIADSFDEINKIIWELLKNTDEHAKKDYLGQSKLLPSTRGLFMRIQRSSKSAFIEGTSHEGLKEYYNSALESEEHTFILEISVFDSGPGLVKKFLGDKWSQENTINDDINTIRKCLIKGQTSVTTSQGQNKGYGLDEVLRLLDKKRGFLNIRSGKASIYRNLIADPYIETINPADVILNDWQNYSKDEYSIMSKIEGTLITLAYPLN